METTHLRRFFEWCVEVELLDLSPARRLRRPKTPRLLPHPIGEGDLAMAVELAEPTRIRPWLLLGAFAGLRACEMAPLRAEAILWDQEPPLIRIEEGKGGSGGTVELSPDLAAYLRACDLPTAGWLFPLRDGREGHRGGPQCVPGGEQLPARDWPARHPPLDAASVRDRAAQVVGRQPSAFAQEGLRHQSAHTTQMYTFVAHGEVAEAIGRLPSLGAHAPGEAGLGTSWRLGGSSCSTASGPG